MAELASPMTKLATDLPADPLALARSLRASGARHVFVLRSADAQALRASDVEASFVGCEAVDRTEALLPDAGPCDRGWGGAFGAPRWVGFSPYESARHLERASWSAPDPREPPTPSRPRWLRYDAVARVDRTLGRVVIEADDVAAAFRLRARLSTPPAPAARFRVGPLAWSDDDDAHARKVERVLEYIRAGDVYQVNLARRARFAYEGDPLALFAALTDVAPSPYGFFLDDDDLAIVGSSPELALEVRGTTIRTTPIKGTRARGKDAREDDAHRRELDADPKERAELTMAVDLHRNDFGKVAKPGSVRVLGEPKVVLGRTVMSRVVEVIADLEPGRSAADALAAVLPCGSVTGAPKVRAMEIIRELESARRGLYTGVMGTVRRDGDVTLAMAIRTAVVRKAQASADYFAGGGIVIESDPRREAEETRWKAEQLARLVGFVPGAGPL